MKSIKRLLSFVFAMIMVLAMTVSVFADTTYTITIKGPTGHTYEAYQIFKGDLSGDVLSILLGVITSLKPEKLH